MATRNKPPRSQNDEGEKIVANTFCVDKHFVSKSLCVAWWDWEGGGGTLGLEWRVFLSLVAASELLTLALLLLVLAAVDVPEALHPMSMPSSMPASKQHTVCTVPFFKCSSAHDNTWRSYSRIAYEGAHNYYCYYYYTIFVPRFIQWKIALKRLT